MRIVSPWIESTAIKQNLREFVLAELHDTYQLIEKLSALGGSPAMQVPDITVDSDTQKASNEVRVTIR